jgi:hypothetical protein
MDQKKNPAPNVRKARNKQADLIEDSKWRLNPNWVSLKKFATKAGSRSVPGSPENRRILAQRLKKNGQINGLLYNTK